MFVENARVFAMRVIIVTYSFVADMEIINASPLYIYSGQQKAG